MSSPPKHDALTLQLLVYTLLGNIIIIKPCSLLVTIDMPFYRTIDFSIIFNFDSNDGEDIDEKNLGRSIYIIDRIFSVGTKFFGNDSREG